MTTPYHAGMPCDPLTLTEEAELLDVRELEGWSLGFGAGYDAALRDQERPTRGGWVVIAVVVLLVLVAVVWKVAPHA